MSDYKKLTALKLEENVKTNFDLFGQEIEIYFKLTETTKKKA